MASAQPKRDLRIFVDSSVFFAAALSVAGPAHALIIQASRGAALLLISELVIEETRRNLSANAPQALAAFDQLHELACVHLVPTTTKTSIVKVARTVNLKDAPIVGAAVRGRADYLVTHDKKLLRQAGALATAVNLKVTQPAEVLHFLR